MSKHSDEKEKRENVVQTNSKATSLLIFNF